MSGSTNASIRRRFQLRNVGEIAALGVFGQPADRFPGVRASTVEITAQSRVARGREKLQSGDFDS
jgi:hypothetical protein